MNTIPKNFVEILPHFYINSSTHEAVITGVPPEESTSDFKSHCCDSMGCGWEHVLFRGKVSDVCRQFGLQCCNSCDDPNCVDNIERG